MSEEKVNILLVDDQPAKLLSYEVVLRDLGQNLVKASSAQEALETLLKTDVAIVLMDVSMPELDGFELAEMIREHPRFHETAIIFISAIHLTDADFLRAYRMGGVDYVTVPIVPEILRAKVKIFSELHRKTRQLEHLNHDLERRVKERTSEVEAVARRLRESEQRRNIALVAGRMGSWDWNLVTGEAQFDEGQYRILGAEPANFNITAANLRASVHPDDLPRLEEILAGLSPQAPSQQTEFRIRHSDGKERWCLGTAAATFDNGHLMRISGVTTDITDRKRAEQQQELLAREIDHRAKNVLAIAQSIVRLSRGETIQDYVHAVEERINALARAHTLLAQSRWEGADLRSIVNDELAPFRTDRPDQIQVVGPQISLEPRSAQAIALALHELSTNSAKYGALSTAKGSLILSWDHTEGTIELQWVEAGGPAARRPTSTGFGLKVISASVEHQLGGSAVFDWLRSGLRCTLRIPRPQPAPAANEDHRTWSAPPAARSPVREENLATR